MKLVTIFFLLFVGCSPILKSPSLGSQRSAQRNAVSDCPLEFNRVGFCAQLALLQKPILIDKPCTFKLAFWVKDVSTFLGPYVDPGLIPHAWLWMHMPQGPHGSPSSIIVSQEKDASGAAVPGVYDVNRVVFSMASTSAAMWWEIHIELRKNDGTIVDEAVQTIGI